MIHPSRAEQSRRILTGGHSVKHCPAPSAGNPTSFIMSRPIAEHRPSSDATAPIAASTTGRGPAAPKTLGTWDTSGTPLVSPVPPGADVTGLSPGVQVLARSGVAQSRNKRSAAARRRMAGPGTERERTRGQEAVVRELALCCIWRVLLRPPAEKASHDTLVNQLQYHCA